MARRQVVCTVALLCALTLSLCGADGVLAQEARAPSGAPALETPKSVTASLQRALAWYRDARVDMQGLRNVLDTDLDRGEEQTAQRVVQRAFDVALARAAIFAEADAAGGHEGAGPQSGARPDRRAELKAANEHEEREVARLRAQARAATPTARPALDRELAAATNRLDLLRLRLDFATKLSEVDLAAPDDTADLADQIEALRDTVPGMSSTGSGTPTVVTTTARGTPSGVWALAYRLLALQRTRNTLKDLTRRTTDLAQEVRAETQSLRQARRPLVMRLRELAKDPGAGGAPLEAGQQEFRSLLGQVKLLSAVRLPLREESALLQRYASDVQAWIKAVDQEIGHVLRGIGLELLGVGIALTAILVGSVLWKAAVVRYVANAYHRRLLLSVRHVAVVTGIALVLVFHFASELTALVTALGFAAAGIAFALQNVILAVAGYFSMVAPNGIRVGDRVSLQGPFGYVHGEVIEIGVVRTRLRELAGDPLQPTGRIMVFPNSVAFTGSFIKHPPTESPELSSG
jgi:hypothetical protein